MTEISLSDYQGTRPTKTRKIPIKYTSYRGQIRATKLHLQPRRPPMFYGYESQLERDFFYCLDHDQNCVEIIPQPVWTNENGRNLSADCWTLFYHDNIWNPFLFEVKPSVQLLKLTETDTWKEKIAFLTTLCNENEWHFRIVTEEQIHTSRLTNITRFRSAVLIPPKKNLINQVRKVLLAIFRKEPEYSLSQLVSLLQQKLSHKIPKPTIEIILSYLLFYQELWFEWDQPFTPTSSLISLNFDRQILLVPFYETIPPSELNFVYEKEQRTVKMVSADFDIDLLDPSVITEAKERYFAIQPLLKIIQDPHRKLTEIDVENQGQKVGRNKVTLYRWLKKYKQYGDWRGLIMEQHNKGNRSSRLHPEVEEIIQKTITNRAPTTSIKASWKQIQDHCEEHGYPVPSYQTIRVRINSLPAKERFGKQGGYIRDEITRRITGTLPRGEFPLDFVQVDSTKLDIFLVDQLELNIKKRPYLTLAVDARTRMIYTWLLDYTKPNSIAVCQALMRGFLPKEELIEQYSIELPYLIHGIPRRIQFDNAKEFDSNHVKEFCLLHGVEDVQFRHAKRPDLGGYVERMFRTINETWIRDNALPGYTPPLKTRPEGLTPEKHAKWTLPEFEEWLVKQITIYHHSTHTGLEKDLGVARSPIEQYRQDMTGRSALLPVNPDLLPFEVYPSETRILQPDGVTFRKNKYNDDGWTKKLTTIRRRNRGKPKEILFRYNPQDITNVWIYDEVKREYIQTGISGGLLVRFVKEHPHIPVRLSEYLAITRQLRADGKKESPSGVKSLLTETQQIAEEIKRRRQIQQQSVEPTADIKDEEEETEEKIDPFAGMKFPPELLEPYERNDPFAGVEFPPELLEPTPQKKEDPLAHIKITLDDLHEIGERPTRKDKETFSRVSRSKD